jgi:hypothetical protein
LICFADFDSTLISRVAGRIIEYTGNRNLKDSELQQGASVLDNARESGGRWSIFRSSLFVILCAAACWILIGAVLYSVLF